jgi:predicted dehydrogenase
MKSVTRREFMNVSAAGAAAVSSLAARSRRVSANDRVVVAVIGLRGMGRVHVSRLLEVPDAVCACLCDVDQSMLERESKKVHDATGQWPKMVKDFRHVLEDTSIDAVVVATPHHWHIPIAIPVLQSGKDLYVEKPASHVFREGRLLVEAARKYGRIVQHGTQMRSTNVTLRAAEVLKSGLMGEIKMTKAWNVQRGNALEPKPDGPVPDGVDYDRWLGPAPKRPFNPNRFHRSWRVYRDYGNGDMGDDGAHDIDMACWALGVTTHPVRITSHGSTIDLEGEREYPDNMTVALQYAEGKVLLYEDRLWTPYGLHGYDNGNAFYGTEGYMIFSRRGHFQVYMGRKEEKGPGVTGREFRQNSRAHMDNFLDSVKTRKQPYAPADVAHLSCGVIHLAEIAYRVGRVLEFDPETETFPHDSEANAMLTKPYREPWTLPEKI